MILMSSPQRMCIVCRNMFPKEALLRVTKNKDGIIYIDPTGKSQGRGAYICKSNLCKEKLVKSRALSRALHCEISEEITNTILKELI